MQETVETAVSLIPKEEVAFLKEKGEDKKFIEFITNELSEEISERLIQVLENNDEIIIKKPVLKVSEYKLLYSVEYRKTVNWRPLVRCKDCIHHKNAPQTTDVWCERVDGLLPKDWFCADGDRGENAEIF